MQSEGVFAVANLQFEGLNVSLTEIKPPDYLNKDNVQKDEVTDKFYAQADALLKACQAKLKTGTTQILSTGTQRRCGMQTRPIGYGQFSQRSRDHRRARPQILDAARCAQIVAIAH